MAKTMYVLNIKGADSIPSVEVCESIPEVMKSVKWQLGESKATPELMKQAEQTLTTTRTWTDPEGTIYTVRIRGGK